MKTFLSWSGNKSHSAALAFSDWIPCVIQAIEPWVSSKDIDRGSIWFNEIFEQLKDTNFGVVFVTKENQDKPWLLFESGALSKGLSENRICTVLIDLDVRDIDAGSPLRHLNHTVLEKNSVLALVKTINKNIKESTIQEKHLEISFNALWPDLDSKLQEILLNEPVSAEPRRDDADVLNDILDNVLNIHKKISRPNFMRHSQHISPDHAKVLVKNLVKMALDYGDIVEAVGTVIPDKWLKQELESYGMYDEDADES